MLISNKDMRIVSYQLGKTPKNVVRVVRRCSYGFPVVIESKSILEGKPFPTVYWLTCPFLKYAISRIESLGGILKFENILSNSPELYAKHVEAHLKAQARAIELADKNVRVIKSLKKRGMGGLSDFKHVKCLHMHVAYHFGGIENPVGRMVLSELEVQECESGLCENVVKEVK